MPRTVLQTDLARNPKRVADIINDNAERVSHGTEFIPAGTYPGSGNMALDHVVHNINCQPNSTVVITPSAPLSSTSIGENTLNARAWVVPGNKNSLLSSSKDFPRKTTTSSATLL